MNEAETVVIDIHPAADAAVCPYCGEKTVTTELAVRDGNDAMTVERAVCAYPGCEHLGNVRKNAAGVWQLIFVREWPQ